jgi:hypothetical protein
MIIRRSILLSAEKSPPQPPPPDKSCRENYDTHFMFAAFFFFKSSRFNVERYGTAGQTIGDSTGGANKSLARPRRKAISMSKYSWIMNPTRSHEMPSCSAIDLAEIRRSFKTSSWIWSIISGVVGLRTYQRPGIIRRMRFACWMTEATHKQTQNM